MKAEESFVRLPDLVTGIRVGIPGMTARLIKRDDHRAIYFRWDGCYEVFRVIIKKEGEIFGRPLPRREEYPSNDDFGRIAWCFHDKTQAMAMYDNIPDLIDISDDEQEGE